jgi:glutathione S-transferase
MLQLFQFPWSPYCLVQRRILEFSGAPHQIVNVPATDRSVIWKETRQRYYQVPVLKDGKNVLFETGENSQVIAKYLESKLQLGLFPREWEGIQDLIWENIENEIEGFTFKLNDGAYKEFVPKGEQLNYLRFKERKFGKGCLRQWAEQALAMQRRLAEKLLPYEQMLGNRPFLLDRRPRFVDFDLWGMLANFHFSGKNKLPASRPKLKAWYARMGHVKFDKPTK